MGWRTVFALGLAGGVVPSTSALLILLATAAVGRAAFGLVLVVAFGLGMAIVLATLGVAAVHLRGWLVARRAPRGSDALARVAPLGGALVVLAVGLWLTAQAVVTGQVV